VAAGAGQVTGAVPRAEANVVRMSTAISRSVVGLCTRMSRRSSGLSFTGQIEAGHGHYLSDDRKTAGRDFETERCANEFGKAASDPTLTRFIRLARATSARARSSFPIR